LPCEVFHDFLLFYTLDFKVIVKRTIVDDDEEEIWNLAAIISNYPCIFGRTEENTKTSSQSNRHISVCQAITGSESPTTIVNCKKLHVDSLVVLIPFHISVNLLRMKLHENLMKSGNIKRK
jgi:hypothetical protein